MPEHGGKIQIEHDDTAVPQCRTAIPNEGELQGAHNVAREGQEPDEARINHRFHFLLVLVWASYRKTDGGFAECGHSACDQGWCVAKRPPRW